MRLKFSWFVTLFSLICAQVSAQHHLLVEAWKPEEKKALETLTYNRQPADTIAARLEVSRLLGVLQEEGYLLANSLSFYCRQDSNRATISLGPAFKWARLQQGNVENAWLDRTSWRQRDYTHRPFRYQQVARLMQQLIEQAENAGFPFAAVRLDSIQVEGAFLEASLQMERGPFMAFDTLELQAKGSLSAKFLAAHLGIRPGEAYNQQKVQEIEGRLGNLPYLSLQQAPRVSFQNEQATIYLDLHNKKANVLDGIIGLMPDPQHAERMLLTGQLDLQLRNPFGGGKEVALHWQRLSRQSQNLEVAYHHPYLMGSPLSFNVGFKLLKEEESFVNRELNLETQFRQGAHNTLSLLVSQKDARLLSGAEDGLLVGFSLWQYGLGFKRQRLDDPFVPKRGHRLFLDLMAGQKRVRTIGSGTDSARHAVPSGTVQIRATAGLEYYRPIGKRLVWAHKLKGGFLEDEHLFLNDLFRLGGLSSLRGFREKEFFAANYLLSSLELRYLAGSQTYLFLFYDQLWMEQRLGNLHVNDWPLGFGSGLSLGTKSGTFNFVYALSRSGTQPLNFTQSQVHFGYVNRF